MDNEAFDPELLKKAAAAISESLTSNAAEREKTKRDDEDIKKKIANGIIPIKTVTKLPKKLFTILNTESILFSFFVCFAALLPNVD